MGIFSKLFGRDKHKAAHQTADQPYNKGIDEPYASLIAAMKEKGRIEILNGFSFGDNVTGIHFELYPAGNIRIEGTPYKLLVDGVEVNASKEVCLQIRNTLLEMSLDNILSDNIVPKQVERNDILDKLMKEYVK